MIEWGAVADDVTGATDLATNFVSAGRRTAVFFGATTTEEILAAGPLDVAIIALKSRTATLDQAVSTSREAMRALDAAGAERLYVKYCSTFDSTPQGNIGPIIDVALAEKRASMTIVVPSFPDAGRTVYRGHLFVGDHLLSESSMKDHPLTPMRESYVPSLLGPQTRADVVTLDVGTVERGADLVSDRLRSIAAEVPPGGTVCVVVDAIRRADLATIMDGARALKVISGGSGLAQGLAVHGSVEDARSIEIAKGRRVVLSGSASARTREQVAHAVSRQPARRIDIDLLQRDFASEIDHLTRWASECWEADETSVPLIYSVGALEDLSSSGGAEAVVEAALGELATRLVDLGVRQIIVAGGESSGRVLADLQVRSLRIGPIIAAGVAWSEGRTSDGKLVSLALKSGNFGDAEMFETAWDALEGEVR